MVSKPFTKVDWLAFRTKAAQPGDVLEGIRGAFGSMGQYLRIQPRSRGWQGYEQSADLLMADMSLGLMAYGGEAQNEWIYTGVTGQGCDWVADWDEADHHLSKLPAFDARRVDIALDIKDRTVTHETLLSAYRAGLFCPPGAGGRPPKCLKLEPEDPKAGRTINIGTRTSDKYLRGYEKGLQIAAGLPLDGCTAIDGVAPEDWYRVELELKPKTAPLPSDLIARRDHYFAGAYPYLQRILAVEPDVLVMSRDRVPQLDLAKALEQIRHQYGATLFTALHAYEGDISAIWTRIVGKKHNEALLRAGVLLVDH